MMMMMMMEAGSGCSARAHNKSSARSPSLRFFLSFRPLQLLRQGCLGTLCFALRSLPLYPPPAQCSDLSHDAVRRRRIMRFRRLSSTARSTGHVTRGQRPSGQRPSRQVRHFTKSRRTEKLLTFPTHQTLIQPPFGRLLGSLPGKSAECSDRSQQTVRRSRIMRFRRLRSAAKSTGHLSTAPRRLAPSPSVQRTPGHSETADVSQGPNSTKAPLRPSPPISGMAFGRLLRSQA